MVFQYYALFPHLTVAENIVFGLKVRSTRRAQRRSDYSRWPTSSASPGCWSASRSSSPAASTSAWRWARAIVSQSPVCLMDEPLSNLDAQLRHEMRVEIRALQRRLGMTVVYVTHDQVEAMSMADQVVLLREGRIEQERHAGRLYSRPATTFAARFIGTPAMNLVPLETCASRRRARRRARLGVRPEHVTIWR